MDMLKIVKKRNKTVTYAQVIKAFEAYDIMTDAGVPENLSLKIFDVLVNVYASEIHAGRPVPFSRAAQQVLAKGGSKRDLILEHGTPRRALTLHLLKVRRANKLSEDAMKQIIEKYWAIAHITKEEDQRLRDLGLRSKMMDTPRDRWGAAGIEFPDEESIHAREAISNVAQSNTRERMDNL